MTQNAKEAAERLRKSNAEIIESDGGYCEYTRLTEIVCNALLALLSARQGEDGWQDIETAPKDGTRIWVVFRSDLHTRFGRDDLDRWNDVQVTVRHEGVTPSGYDLGWSIAAPVGHGGFPNSWIAGWKPLDPPPSPSGEGETVKS